MNLHYALNKSSNLKYHHDLLLLFVEPAFFLFYFYFFNNKILLSIFSCRFPFEYILLPLKPYPLIIILPIGLRFRQVLINMTPN